MPTTHLHKHTLVYAAEKDTNLQKNRRGCVERGWEWVTDNTKMKSRPIHQINCVGAMERANET